MRAAIVATGLEGDVGTGQLVALILRQRGPHQATGVTEQPEERVSQPNVKM